MIFEILIVGCLVACNNQQPENPTPDHTHSFGGWEITKNATCTEDGVKTRYCDCGEKQSENIAAIGHNYADCVCTNCGDTQELPECKHENLDFVPAENPTCTESGLTEGIICLDCYKKIIEQKIIDALGHDEYYYTEKDENCNVYNVIVCDREGCGFMNRYATGVVDHAWKEATCTEPRTCQRTGCAATDGVENGHSFGDWVTVKEATLTEEGLKERTCSCGEKETESIPAYSIGLEYTLNIDGESYSVTGIRTRTYTDINIPDTYNGLPVTSIGERAFDECSSLISVVIPNSVTSIDEYAFIGCYSLTSVVIGDSVTSIGDGAFYGLQFNEYENCKYLGSKNNPYFVLIEVTTQNLSSYTIHGDTKIIAHSAFSYCHSLTSVVIPDGVTSICDGTFSNCTSLTSIIIPDSVTSIGQSAFHWCPSLTSVVIGDSVTSIGESAFYFCTSLTSVVIPDSVTSIGGWAFYQCTSLSSVVIGHSVTSISDYSFFGCTDLTSIVIPDSVTTIGDRAFFACDSLSSVEIGDSVTFIGDKAFFGCSSLASVLIGDGVISIGNSAFAFCSLTSVIIGDSVTSVGDFAFYSCNQLYSVVIGDGVASIGNSAFDGCWGLRNVYYTGSDEQWKTIIIGSDNSYLTNATIHYNYVPENN